LKVASTAQLSVAPSVEVELAPPAEVMPPASPDATAAVLSEEQQVFIDGSLMRAPLAYDFAEQPGMLPGPNRVRISSLVVGALLLLILVLLYLIAS